MWLYFFVGSDTIEGSEQFRKQKQILRESIQGKEDWISSPIFQKGNSQVLSLSVRPSMNSVGESAFQGWILAILGLFRGL